MEQKLLNRRDTAYGDTSPQPAFLRAIPLNQSACLTPPISSSSAKSQEALEEAVHGLPPFTPYSAQVPWHTGMRALFSQMFPKYGHYCGPNWSSGRSSGSFLWDKPPVDWLDHCCYCHDVGYDNNDQAKLYKADLELLECLQKMPPPKQKAESGNGLSQDRHENSNENVAWLYRNVYITGLQTFLLPYRRLLLRDLDGTHRQ